MLSAPSPRLAALAAALGISCVMAACEQATAPAPAPSSPALARATAAVSYSVYATGFLFPRGLTFGNDGTLYVAEAGSAGNGSTVGQCTQVIPGLGPYVNGPTVLAETWQVRRRPTLFFAGQMSGVEGYVESAASGLLAGLNAAALANGEPASAPPRTTAIGALAYYVSHANPAHYEPSNITFGIMAPLANAPRNKLARKLAMAERALQDLAGWMDARADVRGRASTLEAEVLARGHTAPRATGS